MEAAKAQRCQIRPARSEADLEQLEAAYRVLDLYIWLSFRLEDAFTGAHDRNHFVCLAAGLQGLGAYCLMVLFWQLRVRCGAP